MPVFFRIDHDVATQPHPLAASAGFGIAASLLVAARIPADGLASPLIVAVIACAAGAPLAGWLWRHAPSAPDPAAKAAADAAALVLLAALLGPVAAAGPVLALAVLGLWLASWLLAEHGLLAGAVMWSVAVVVAGAWSASQPIATALLPVPMATPAALPVVLPLGLLLAGVGVSGWSTHLPRVPGDRGTPWVVVGAALLATLAVAVSSAATYGASLAKSTSVPVALVLALCAPGLLSWASVGGGRDRARLFAGLGATAWIAAGVTLGGTGLPELASGVLLPGLMAFGLARRASTAEGRMRTLLGVLSLGLVVCAAAAFQRPSSVPEAAGWGGLAVGAFWMVMAQGSMPTPEVAS